MSAPLFSVIMPAFNAEKYIDDAIKSIIEQSLSDWELIVIDDFSSDSTYNACKNYSDPRIKILKTGSRSGVSAVRNIGLEIAAGEFIAFLDSDDRASCDRLKCQYEFLKSNPQIGVCGTYAEVFSNSANENCKQQIRYPSTSDEIKSAMFFHYPFVTSSIAVRRELIKYLEKPCFRNDVAEDYDFCARLIDITSFYNIPKTLAHYRRHSEQASQTKKSAIDQNIQIIWTNLLEKIEIIPTNHELAIHKNLKGNLTSLNEILEVKIWLEKLYKFGATHQFLNSESWKLFLSTTWFGVCSRGKIKSIALLKVFRSSFLSRSFKSRRELASFYFKCICNTSFDESRSHLD